MDVSQHPAACGGFDLRKLQAVGHVGRSKHALAIRLYFQISYRFTNAYLTVPLTNELTCVDGYERVAYC